MSQQSHEPHLDPLCKQRCFVTSASPYHSHGAIKNSLSTALCSGSTPTSTIPLPVSSRLRLEASAREGCEFCAVLFHGLVTHYTNDTSFDPLPLWRGKWSESPVFLTPVRDDREIYTPGMELTAGCWNGGRYRDSPFVLVHLSGPRSFSASCA
jgi:hypothetical protein